MNTVNFIFCVHNHQPVDNFDHVFQRAYDDAYLPFLEIMERHPAVKFCAHYSGPLLEWIAKNRLEVFMKLRTMVERGQLELLGGGFYEPIFSMLPEEDALGQIEMMNKYLRKHFGRDPAGLWMPERVWEPNYVELLAKSGLKYSILDDFHFRAAGLRDEDLGGYYLTEDRGAIFNLFPGREELRYSIPFKDPEHTINYLRKYATAAGDRVLVYADDGEKFGSWPRTKKHVYADGWLEKFLETLEKAQDIRTTTFSEALGRVGAVGRVYLPTCSYREMGEWSMLRGTQGDFERWIEDLRRENRFEYVKQFMPGGTWRNFRVKYPEANLMYGRMLSVSKSVAQSSPAQKSRAREELYRGQCNCGYWHGVFGGLYLPHLRASVYRHLLAAENEVDKESSAGYKLFDFDLDGKEDIRLHNKSMNLFVTPASGGRIVEVDARDSGVNLTAGLSRRRETYHERVKQAVFAPEGAAESIHNLVLTKVPGIDRFLQFDPYTHATLLDHFFEPGATLDEASVGGREIGDFLEKPYRHEVSRQRKHVVAALSREGTVRAFGGAPVPVSIRKEISISEEPLFEVEYTLKNLGTQPIEAIFGVEFLFSLLSPSMPDACFHRGDGRPISPLATKGDHLGHNALWIADVWHGLNLGIVASSEVGFWVFPIQTVSMSEGGFELIYQGTVVMPRWPIRLEPGKPWHAVLTHRMEKKQS